MTFKELLECIEDNIENIQKCIDFLSSSEEDTKLDDKDVDIITGLLCNQSNRIKVLELVADLARNESNRAPFTKATLLDGIIKDVGSEDPKLTLQAIRCLCNLCADNGDAKVAFSQAGGVKLLLLKGEEIVEKDDSEWNELICPACSCIQNLIADDETLCKAFLEENTMNLLWRYLAKFHSNENSKIASTVISGLSSFAENESGLQALFDSGVLKLVVKLLNVTSDEISKIIFENLLKELATQENGRTFLNKCDSISEISKIIESRSNFQETDIDEITKEMTDFIVLLTSGEESFNVLKSSDPNFLTRFSSWISSPNKHVQVSAGLALGNYARDEETCTDIVKSGIHENLINIMTENVKDEGFSDRAQAYGSCLRNLCIPVPNKQLLYKAGLHSMAISCILERGTESSSLPTQFKALAILRLLLQDNVDLSSSICMNETLVKKVMSLAETSVVTSVPAEAQRLLAAAIKYSSSEVTIKAILKNEPLEAIMKLMLSEHTIMQSEGLIALIMTAVNVPDCIDLFKEKECVQKIFKLLTKAEIQAQTCFNGLTCLQAIMSLKGGKDLLVANNVDEVLDSLKTHSEDIIKNKAEETKQILQSI